MEVCEQQETSLRALSCLVVTSAQGSPHPGAAAEAGGSSVRRKRRETGLNVEVAEGLPRVLAPASPGHGGAPALPAEPSLHTFGAWLAGKSLFPCGVRRVTMTDQHTAAAEQIFPLLWGSGAFYYYFSTTVVTRVARVLWLFSHIHTRDRPRGQKPQQPSQVSLRRGFGGPGRRHGSSSRQTLHPFILELCNDSRCVPAGLRALRRGSSALRATGQAGGRASRLALVSHRAGVTSAGCSSLLHPSGSCELDTRSWAKTAEEVPYIC